VMAFEKQASALRLMLTGQRDEYLSMVRAFDADETRDFLVLLAGAFLELVDREFAGADLPSAVVEWVGALRAESDAAARLVDPVRAEQAILLALGLSEADQLSAKEVRDTQLLLLPILADGQHLGSDEIDQLLAAARVLAES
jgi:hypothetical protein